MSPRRPVAADGRARPRLAPVSGPLALVRERPLFLGSVEAWLTIRPGDRVLVAAGESVLAGAVLAERFRDRRTVVVDGPAGDDAEPGSWWTGSPSRRDRSGDPPSGELLFASGGRWRVATGEPADALEAPFAGIVRDVRPGAGIAVEARGRGLLGTDVLGGPVTGRLQIAARRDGHLRASAIDVGAAGSILVVGASIDAEAITRARAVGVRGMVVSGLGVKERREVLASERRSQAGTHGLPPFAVLVLDGAIGRPIASPVMAVLEALEGSTVAIVDSPPCLVLDEGFTEGPAPARDLVRVLAGPLAGAEGRWAGLAGPHRFAGGVIIEAGWVALDSGARIAIPLGDLERYA